MGPGARTTAAMHWVFRASRIMTLLGVVALLAAAATLLVFGVVETGR